MRRWLVLLAAAVMVVAAACEAFGSPELSAGPPVQALPSVSSVTPGSDAASPTEAPTAAPAIVPTGPKLAANNTLRYTSSTSPGRLIELKVTVRNRGTTAGGKITMEIEGLNYTLKRKTPLVGCVPNCKAATGADGVAHVVWTAPAAGGSKAYTAQLRAKVRGTFRYAVRVYAGTVGAYGDELGSWSATTRVR